MSDEPELQDGRRMGAGIAIGIAIGSGMRRGDG